MTGTRRALVLGVAGFVGRHLAAALDRAGWYVAGLDVTRGPDQDIRRRLPLTRDGYDLVAHCAAVIGGRAVIDGDPLALAENLELDAIVTRWCARRRPGRLLYFSSSAVYPVHLQEPDSPDLPPSPPSTRLLTEAHAGAGDPRRLLFVPGVGHVTPPGDPTTRLLTEAHAQAADYCGTPDRLYGWAKLVGEAQCLELAAAGVPVTVVRPFSGYGSDQPSDYPFGAFADRALAREDPFVVWGDGDQVRDWVHVDDVVATCLAAVDQAVSGPLNICTGRATTFADLARLFANQAGYHPALLPLRSQPTGVHYRVGDPTQLLALRPPTITLEQGVARALAERRGPA